jgi:hypothetical protein
MKKTKITNYLTLLLLIFFCLINLVSAQASKSKDNIEVKVTYFHATMRCQTCMKIEKYTNESINNHFQKELKNGKIILESIDFQDEKNEHFMDDYKFDTQALIVAKFKNGKQVKWKSLEKIWDYVNDYSKFEKYIVKELKSFL